MTQPIIQIILLVIAAVLIIAAIIFVYQARHRHTRSNRAAYNVDRQQAHRAMRLNLLSALAAMVVGLVLFGIYFLLPDSSEAESAPVLTVEPSPAATLDRVETAVPATATSIPGPTATATDLPPAVVSTLTPIPTSPPSASSTPEPEPTATAVVPEVLVKTAVVTSGVGVWLRSAPSVDGDQLEWLLTDTQVVVLEGQATADEFDWQEVQAPSGNVGWVAVPFIELVVP